MSHNCNTATKATKTAHCHLGGRVQQTMLITRSWGHTCQPIQFSGIKKIKNHYLGGIWPYWKMDTGKHNFHEILSYMYYFIEHVTFEKKFSLKKCWNVKHSESVYTRYTKVIYYYYIIIYLFFSLNVENVGVKCSEFIWTREWRYAKAIYYHYH